MVAKGALATRYSMKPTILKSIKLAVLIVFACLPLYAQDNYEIQVYGSDVVAPGRYRLSALHSSSDANTQVPSGFFTK